MFLLDTDRIGIIQRQTEPEFNRLSHRMGRCSPSDFFVSIVSFQEQFLGWNQYVGKARTTAEVIKGYACLLRILTDFAATQVLPFDEASGEAFDSLRQRRIRTGTMDLRIASTALSKNLTVLTRNLQDFQKVPGLQVEDWTQ